MDVDDALPGRVGGLFAQRQDGVAVGELVGELDDLRQAAEVLAEHDDAREAHLRQVVQAGLDVEQLRLGQVGDVLPDQLVHGGLVGADGLRADLLVVADDDGLAGDAERRQAEQVALRALVDDDDVEHRGGRVEGFHDPVGRHDPYRHRRLGLLHRLLGDGPPVVRVLARALPDLAQGLHPGGQCPAFGVGEPLGHGQPGGFGRQARRWRWRPAGVCLRADAAAWPGHRRR